MRNERIVISRQRLLDEVWGYDPFSTTNTIEVFVSNLRRKLEAGGEPRLLHTIRGAGYVLRVVEVGCRSGWRLAGGSAVLTFVILCVVRGRSSACSPTTAVRGQFNDEVRAAADQLQQGSTASCTTTGSTCNCTSTTVHLNDYASAEHAADPDLRPSTSCCARRTRCASRAPRRRSTPGVHQSARRNVGSVTRARLPGRGAQPRRSSRSATTSSCSTRARSPTSTTRWRACSSSCCSACSAAPSLALLGGAGDRPARDGADRRADRRPRARSSARATPACTSPSPRPTTRSPSWRARSRGCSARSTPRAARPRRCSSASASSSPTPRTSCARR